MPPSPRTGLEMVLFSLGDGWHLIGHDREGLIALCHSWLEGEPAAPRDHAGRHAEARALWILDRLLPRDDAEPFRGMEERGTWGEGAFALWRRAPAELEHLPPEVFARRSAVVQAAWVDSRTRTEDLLAWPRICAERGWRTDDHHGDGLAIREYLCRGGESAPLLAILGESSVQAGCNLVEGMLRRVAGRVARTREPAEDLESRLEAAGEQDLAQAVRRMVERHAYLPGHFAEVLWTEQLTAGEIETLVRDSFRFSYGLLARLVAVCPPRRFDLWWHLLRTARLGVFPIRRFCEWIRPEDRDLLLPHFDSESDEWAACAFQAYLSMVPHGIADLLAEQANRPAWQQTILDRFLHAPDELKPPPYVTDTQETEADFRLYDPFNVRAY